MGYYLQLQDHQIWLPCLLNNMHHIIHIVTLNALETRTAQKEILSIITVLRVNPALQNFLILLDFSKATDYQCLLSKLDCCGFQDRSLDCIKAFLTSCTKVILINGPHSNPRTVVAGVPRGQCWVQCYFYSIWMKLQITLAPICAFSQTTVSSKEKSICNKIIWDFKKIEIIYANGRPLATEH